MARPLLTEAVLYMHALRIKRQNKGVCEIKRLLISSNKSKCYILMNVGTFNDNLPDNTILM
jgi:hypothetical protein